MEREITESPRKYGNFDDDIDELAARLDGREFVPGSDRSPNRAVPASDTVDEDFLREIRNQSNKYGR